MSHRATAASGAGSQAVDGRGGMGYLRPALEVIHSSPWHNLDKEKKYQ